MLSAADAADIEQVIDQTRELARLPVDDRELVSPSAPRNAVALTDARMLLNVPNPKQDRHPGQGDLPESPLVRASQCGGLHGAASRVTTSTMRTALWSRAIDSAS